MRRGPRLGPPGAGRPRPRGRPPPRASAREAPGRRPPTAGRGRSRRPAARRWPRAAMPARARGRPLELRHRELLVRVDQVDQVVRHLGPVVRRGLGRRRCPCPGRRPSSRPRPARRRRPGAGPGPPPRPGPDFPEAVVPTRATAAGSGGGGRPGAAQPAATGMTGAVPGTGASTADQVAASGGGGRPRSPARRRTSPADRAAVGGGTKWTSLLWLVRPVSTTGSRRRPLDQHLFGPADPGPVAGQGRPLDHGPQPLEALGHHLGGHELVGPWPPPGSRVGARRRRCRRCRTRPRPPRPGCPRSRPRSRRGTRR